MWKLFCRSHRSGLLKNPVIRSISILLCGLNEQIHWLRVILDEGHIIGARPSSESSRNRHLKAIRAERRWIMTGTPTPNTPKSKIGHLHPLLAFLRLDPYGVSKNAWDSAVQKPFELGSRKGVLRFHAEKIRNKFCSRYSVQFLDFLDAAPLVY